MLKAICLGRVKYDINLLVENLPEEGSTQEFFEKTGCGGGLASNVAVGLGKWGISCAISGVIGNDVYGNKIKEDFEKVHLDTRYLEPSYNNDTPLSAIIINKASGKHTIYNMSDKYVSLKKCAFDFSPDIIVVDGYDAVASKNLLERFPHTISILCTSIITKETIDLCRKAKYVICSQEFAENVAGIKIDFQNMKTLGEVYQKLKKRYLKTEFIITLGEKGTLYCVNNQIKVTPSLKVNVIDTHGSKDSFCIGFAYSIVNDQDLEKAVKYGSIAGGLATTKVGARLAIPTLEDVKKIYEQNY